MPGTNTISSTIETVSEQFEWKFNPDNPCEPLPEDENDDGEFNFYNHGGFKNWNSGDSWLEGWAEFWSCVLQREMGLDESQDGCQYPNPIPTDEPIDIEVNIKVWDRIPTTSFGIPIPGVSANIPCIDIMPDEWCEFRELEEFAVASLLWDLYDPKSTLDKDDVDLSLGDLWRIIGNPTENNDLSDMKDVYDAFRDALVGLSNEDGSPVTRTTLDQIFVNHGFFEDINNNQEHETGEQIGWAGAFNRR